MSGNDFKSKLMGALKFEDYWAIIIALFILLASLCFVMGGLDTFSQKLQVQNTVLESEANRASFKTIEWHEAAMAKSAIKLDNKILLGINKILVRPKSWSKNPLDAFYLSAANATEKSEANKEKYETAKATTISARASAVEAQSASERAGFNDATLNKQAEDKIDTWLTAVSDETKARNNANIKPYNLFGSLFILMLVLCLIFSVGTKCMAKPTKQFILGFFPVFILATLAYFLSAQVTLKSWGLEYVLWGLVLGLLVSNTVGTPKIMTIAGSAEYYIKTGLILLGASILMSKVVLIGLPGIFVTWFVTPIVLVLTFWFGDKVIKLESKTLNMVMSADMSVSGVSAAIAAAAACKAKKEELTLSVGISIMFTAVMMIVMPMVIKKIGMNPVLGGAWIGGSIDSTGAVVAAGEYLGPVARDVAATIKMIQNIIIGVMAFAVAAYWTLKVDKTAGEGRDFSFKGSLQEIWKRFPRFILGFIGASVLFSIIYAVLGTDLAKVTIDTGVMSLLITPLQGWLFCLAFTCIGLSTNFTEIAKQLKGGKPIVHYVVGKVINLGLTFAVAYLMFEVIFKNITERLMK